MLFVTCYFLPSHKAKVVKGKGERRKVQTHQTSFQEFSPNGITQNPLAGISCDNMCEMVPTRETH